MAFTDKIMGRLRGFATDEMQEILLRMGLQQRPSTLERLLPSIGFFTGGVVVGIGIGLLFAPRSGAETRESIRKGATKVGERAKEIYGSMMTEAEHAVETASESFDAIAKQDNDTPKPVSNGKANRVPNPPPHRRA